MHQLDLLGQQNPPAAMRPMPAGGEPFSPPDSARPARNASTGHPDQRGRRETSRAAYAELDLSKREAEVMAYVRAHPGRDWTRAELARDMGWRDGPMCGRVNALIAKGALVEGPARDCRVGKRGATVRAA